jgi:hypothetical protein
MAEALDLKKFPVRRGSLKKIIEASLASEYQSNPGLKQEVDQARKSCFGPLRRLLRRSP